MCVPKLAQADAQAKAAETIDEDEINDDRMGLHQRSGGAERLEMAYHKRAGPGAHHEQGRLEATTIQTTERRQAVE